MNNTSRNTYFPRHTGQAYMFTYKYDLASVVMDVPPISTLANE